MCRRIQKVLARHDDLEVTLVTRDNVFLFTPTLVEPAPAEQARAGAA